MNRIFKGKCGCVWIEQETINGEVIVEMILCADKEKDVLLGNKLGVFKGTIHRKVDEDKLRARFSIKKEAFDNLIKTGEIIADVIDTLNTMEERK